MFFALTPRATRDSPSVLWSGARLQLLRRPGEVITPGARRRLRQRPIEVKKGVDQGLNAALGAEDGRGLGGDVLVGFSGGPSRNHRHRLLLEQVRDRRRGMGRFGCSVDAR